MSSEATLIQMLSLFVIPGLFMAAGIFDVLTTRIPDWVSISIVSIFVFAAFAGGLPLTTIGLHLGAGILVFLLGFLAFSLGWMGGGDGKLAAAGAVWFGPALGPQFLMLSFVYGGLMALGMLVLRRVPLPAALVRQDWFAQWLQGQEGLPFGLAMAAAVLTVIRYQF